VINPGDYNKRITILRVDEEKDNGGFAKNTETVVLSPYAKVKTTKGFTLIQNNSDFEKAFTNFTIRFPRNTIIERDMMIRYKGDEYKIEYLNNVDEADIELEIQAKKVKK